MIFPRATGFVVRMKNYSQGKEQEVILNYFGGRIGSLLDIGANDGEFFSNSRALMILGWHGVLVEPSPVVFDRLRNLYAPSLYGPTVGASQVKFGNATLIRAAITERNGPIEFHESGTHLNKGDLSLLSTTKPEELNRWKKSGEEFTKTVVRGIDFDTLVNQAEQSHFDFISIDAEGADWSILRQIDLKAVGCQLLCVEYNAKDENKFKERAAQFGMKLIFINYENLIFGV